MKKFRVLLMVTIMIITSTVQVSATAYLLDWNLVDSSIHLDYDGDSAHMTNIIQGFNMWQSVRSGVIRRDTIFTTLDVWCYDYEEVSNINAV